MHTTLFRTMGTMLSLRAERVDERTLERVRTVFRDADDRFSLYSPTSELSRVADRSLPLPHASSGLRELYAEAVDWRQRTGGAFTPHRPDGVIDLSGIVKAAAMQRAATVLEDAGSSNWCLNVGGDVLACGSDGPDPWTVGIVDPADRTHLLARLTIDRHRPAVATSGSTERGDHIWRTGDPARSGFIQVTVGAADVVTADVLATAIVAAGPDGLDDLADRFPIDVLTVDDTGALRATPGMRRAVTDRVR